MKKIWKIALSVIIVTIIGGSLIYSSTKGIETKLLEVKPQTIAKTFKEEGIVVPNSEQQLYTVSGGKVVSIPVKEGQAVNQGDLLVVFDTAELNIQLQRLRANLTSIEGQELQNSGEPFAAQVKAQQLQIDKAQQDLDSATDNLSKFQKLYDQGAISKEEYTNVQNAVKTATNVLQQQMESLSLLYESNKTKGGTSQYYQGLKQEIYAQINLINYQIKNANISAPQDGAVSDLTVKIGDVLPPSTPLMKIFQKGAYNVEVYILTEDAAKVESGMKVDLIQNNKNENTTFDGTVLTIAPSAIEKLSPLGLAQRKIKIIVSADAPQNITLRPGYALDVQFTTEKEDSRLVVPKTSLFPYNDGYALWTVSDGKAKIQTIKKGFENDTDVAIIDGLKSGDLVIINPQTEGLKEGSKIKRL